jgi:hypothetical protein
MKNYAILLDMYERYFLENRYPGYLFHLTKKDALYSHWAGPSLGLKGKVLIECTTMVVEDGIFAIYDVKILAKIPDGLVKTSFEDFLDTIIRTKKKIPKRISRLDLIMED